MTYFVVDVGGTFIKYALMDDHGNFLEKGKYQRNLIQVMILSIVYTTSIKTILRYQVSLFLVRV